MCNTYRSHAMNFLDATCTQGPIDRAGRLMCAAVHRPKQEGDIQKRMKLA